MTPVIIFHGPPNAGKSSQARRLAERHGYAYISSGDLLRNSKDPEIVARLVSGALARSEDIERLMRHELERIPAGQPIVLDGFPRMINEFHEMEKWLAAADRAVQRVYEIFITPEESHRRSQSRGRHDDHSTDVRWDWYRKETGKVLAYCEEQGWLVRVDGAGTPDEVAARVEAAR